MVAATHRSNRLVPGGSAPDDLPVPRRPVVHRPAGGPHWMQISVTIATHNRVALLLQTLDSLRQVDWRPLGRPPEIVVVDNVCTDGTRAQVEAWAGRHGYEGSRPVAGGTVVRCADGTEASFRLVREQRLGLGWARQRCVEEARGEIVAFLDDDVLVSRGWAQGLATAFTARDVQVVCGRVTGSWQACPRPAWLPPDLEWVVSVFDLGEKMFLQHRPDGIGANFAVRKEVFGKIGGFRGDLGRHGRKLTGGEELELFQRMRRAAVQGAYCGEMHVAHWIPAERLHREYFSRVGYCHGRSRIAIHGRGRGLSYLRKVAAHTALFCGYGAAACWARCRRDETNFRRWLVRAQTGRGGIAALARR